MKNALVDEALVPGAGAFESALSVHLLDEVRKSVEGRAKRGVEAFAEAISSSQDAGGELPDTTLRTCVHRTRGRGG